LNFGAIFCESGGKRDSPNFHGTGEGASNGVELIEESMPESEKEWAELWMDGVSLA